MNLSLAVLSETASKITLGWVPVPGAAGYRFQSSATAPKWSHTWDPMRSQVTFARADWYRVEALGVEAAGEYPAPTKLPLALRLPAKFHIWGGNEQAKMAECDLVVCSFTSSADPRLARETNPGLIALSHPALDPFHPDWTQRKGFAWTYGGGLRWWAGVNDTLEPSAQGPIRGWQETDAGCRQADGLQGFALQRAETADFVARAVVYAYKLGRFAERGYDGIWSDNLFPSDVLAAGWCYGSCGASVDRAAWDAGIVTITRRLRSLLGPMILGGNVVYRSTSPTLRSETSVALRENLDVVISQGIDAVWADVQQMYAWASTPSVDGAPKLIAINDRVAQADTARQRFGLGVALIYGGAYAAYDGDHTNTYWPAEITENGQRRYLGLPTGPPVRSGSLLSRQYGERIVRVDFAARSASFA